MKVVILAGGLGTRISEETTTKPKPMVEIGGKPILWHILKIYSYYGLTEFIICCGYKGYMIKEFFANYNLHLSDITFDLKNNTQTIHNSGVSEPWKITLVETGESTLTGGRLKRIQQYVKNEDLICLTYGDGLGNINIQNLIDFHKKNNKLVTLTGTYPPARFGALKIKGNAVIDFHEKPEQEHIVNGGYFVMSPKVIDFIEGDQTSWEKEPLEKLARQNQLGVFKHDGFWRPMDTISDRNYLENLWNSGRAPWKIWD